MWMLLIGMMFITGVLCLVIALYQLTAPGPANTLTIQPSAATEETAEQGPKRTKLGRPIEERRLSA